jgi:hypothetical protein
VSEILRTTRTERIKKPPTKVGRSNVDMRIHGGLPMPGILPSHMQDILSSPMVGILPSHLGSRFSPTLMGYENITN